MSRFWPLLVLAAAHAALASTIDPNAVILSAQRNAIANWADYASANNISGWDAATPVCSWTAVACDAAGAVTGIDLGCSSAGSTGGGSSQFCATKALGTVAPELAGLRSLTSLFLNGQSFIGSLPLAWGPGGFPKLTTLVLSDNVLTGSIPESWAAGSFASLTAMDLRGNPQLCGPVPASLTAAVCGTDGSRCSGVSLGACSGLAPAPASARLGCLEHTTSAPQGRQASPLPMSLPAPEAGLTTPHTMASRLMPASHLGATAGSLPQTTFACWLAIHQPSTSRTPCLCLQSAPSRWTPSCPQR